MQWFSHQWRRLMRLLKTEKPSTLHADMTTVVAHSGLFGYFDVAIQTVRRLSYALIGVLAIGMCLGVGVLTGYFAAIIDQTPVPTPSALQRTLTNVDQSTHLYYAKNVSLAHVKSDLIRDQVTVKQMSPYLTKAIVATEDEDFYTHHGVVPKALIRAIFSDLTGIGGQTGGSTLTQQVVKMQFLNSETTFKRKATEIMYALRLEHFFSKDQIIEAYLNIATLGRNNKGQNIAGVETAAQGLFGVSAKQLSLPQAAFIAGLPQSPSIYTPYLPTGALKQDLSAGIDRQKTVLFRMYRANMISEAEYQKAKAYDLKKDFLPTQTADEETNNDNYVYNMVTSEAKAILSRQLAQEAGYDEAQLAKAPALAAQFDQTAQTLFATKGYQVHSTIDKTIYEQMQQTLLNHQGTFGQTYSTTEMDPKTGGYVVNEAPVQNGSVLLDNKSGAILGFIGGVSGELNHIYTMRSPGSTIKPLLVYGPAVENKLIGSRTGLADFKTHFKGYSVTDFGNQIQNQFVPAEKALAMSYNIPAVNLYNELRQKVDVRDYMDKMGITTLTDNDYNQLGLALGGTDYGMTVQEVSGAFATFARNGRATEAYVIDSITDPAGNVVYKHKPVTTQVFSPATNYVMNRMLHQVVTTGTAASLSYQLSFQHERLVGKTGTTNDFRDIWFAGTMPNVTLTSWMGYDNAAGEAHALNDNASETNLAFWAALANDLQRVDPDLFQDGPELTMPSTVKRVKVDAQTGLPAGTVNYNNRRFRLDSGTSETSYFADWAPKEAAARFGIGGTDDDYDMFYDRFRGLPTNYGVITTRNPNAVDDEDEDDD